MSHSLPPFRRLFRRSPAEPKRRSEAGLRAGASVRPGLEELESRCLLSVARPDHVVMVIEENHSYSQIIGSQSAPYINALAKQGALFTQSFATSHPSQPNYLELFSGSNQGVTTDNIPTQVFTTPNLGAELLQANLTFGGYSESLPAVGSTVSSSGAYVRRHNPWVDWQGGTSDNAIPASANLRFSDFPTDFGSLPTVSIVVPNLNNDMHDGSVQQGDTWLYNHLDAYVQWAQTNNSLLIVTFDENDGSSGNHIATLFVGPMVIPGQYSETITHDNVLRTIEDMYGLPHAGASDTATPITDVWLPQPSDPGFETPAVGAGTYGSFQYQPDGSPWTFDAGSGVAGNGSGFTAGNPDAPQGAQVAFLQATGTVSQAVTFAAGTYSLSFLAAQRQNFQYSMQTFEVLIDDTVVGTYTPESTSYTGYATASFTVTAGAHTIQFVGLDPDGQDNTAFIDQVRVNRVLPLLNDPGFETPVVGTGTYDSFQYQPGGSPWAFDSGSGVAGNGSRFTAGNPDAPQGTQVAFLQGYGSASQSLTFAAGTYRLAFSAAQRGDGNDSSQTFQVLIDNTVVGTFTPGGASYTGYATASFTVTAGAHTIQFVGLDPDGQDNTALLDRVFLLQ
jgi:hypothetical protein